MKATCNGKCESVPLAQTLGSWLSFERRQSGRIVTVEAHLAASEALGGCGDSETAAIAQIRERIAVFNDWSVRADLPHESRGTISLSPDVDVDIVVYEKVSEGGKLLPTTKDGKKFTCSPKSNFLTLSAGTLISTLSSRSYRTVAVPKTGPAEGPGATPGAIQTLNETFNALAVDHGNGLSPHAAALLNYRLPIEGMPKSMGFAISSGPVYRLAGNTDAASLGFFAGVSWTLLNRLFITPGLHVAEFSDFPIGLSEGSFVPSGIGTPSPIKRWTGRFAVSVTYQTKKLSAPKLTGTANNLPNIPAAPGTPAPATTGPAAPAPATTGPAAPAPAAPAPATPAPAAPAPAAPAPAGTLAITTDALTPATVGKPYTAKLEASGGTPTYIWELALGSKLPAGLNLQADTISGTVAADEKVGDYRVTFTVTDSQNAKATKGLVLKVATGTN